MAKNIEDITPPERRSIRDIPIPEGRRKNINILKGPQDINPPVRMDLPPRIPVGASIPEYHADVPPPREYVETKVGRKPSRSGLWITLGLVLVGLAGVGAFSFMSGASFTYVPKTSPLTLNNENFTASKTQGNLLFSIVKLSSQKDTTVPASGEESVSNKATGSIIVYNDFSTDAQKLIKNTRFETTDGKVYRVQSDISVPGKKQTSSGSEPGSLEVTVLADQPGDAYNIGLTDFTLPGLKGDPRFTSIYARSKTPMTGGFVGTIKKASAADVSRVKVTLESAIKDDLFVQAKAQVPADFVLIPSLSKISYEIVPSAAGSSSDAVISEKGDLYGVIFKKEDLDRALAEKNLGTLSGQTVVISDYSPLTWTMASTSGASIQSTENINFQVSGSTKVEWKTDEVALVSDLLGKDKTELSDILKNYPGIMSADASIKPFWKNSFPTDATKIKIVKTDATK